MPVQQTIRFRIGTPLPNSASSTMKYTLETTNIHHHRRLYFTITHNCRLAVVRLVRFAIRLVFVDFVIRAVHALSTTTAYQRSACLNSNISFRYSTNSLLIVCCCVDLFLVSSVGKRLAPLAWVCVAVRLATTIVRYNTERLLVWIDLNRFRLAIGMLNRHLCFTNWTSKHNCFFFTKIDSK